MVISRTASRLAKKQRSVSQVKSSLQNCSMTEKNSGGISLVAAATADAMDVMDEMMALDPDADLSEAPDWWVKLWSRDLDDPEDPDRIIPRPQDYKDYQCIQGYWIPNGISERYFSTDSSNTPVQDTPRNTTEQSWYTRRSPTRLSSADS